MNKTQMDLMNRVLDGEATPRDQQALSAWLNTSPDEAALWAGMEHADRLLRRAPMTNPPVNFSTRVMARVRTEATPYPAQNANRQPLVNGLMVVALVAAILFLGLRLVVPMLIGPLPELDMIVGQANGVLQGAGRVADALLNLAQTYPMLPAVGLASIPLAFATLWLAVYYTPKDRLRHTVAHYLL